ncbi:MAG: 3-methyl-2-oxobutanoate dehydrogenase (2-methylpropanoyl-transferring) subunit alpha, partial [Alphaproteobacteria bacterium]|nr:3-methyl-2-oxobutanoate dehydrogenase (2-methylpropanoyl-transferring) subunit alpha [Alphaproteobacteria bacterium]
MRNRGSLSLHIPQPKRRPGEKAEFSHVAVPKAGTVERPPSGSRAQDTTNLAYSLIRVLDDEDHAVGPWNPKLDAETLRKGLRAMMLTRAYDDRMYRTQ